MTKNWYVTLFCESLTMLTIKACTLSSVNRAHRIVYLIWSGKEYVSNNMAEKILSITICQSPFHSSCWKLGDGNWGNGFVIVVLPRLAVCVICTHNWNAVHWYRIDISGKVTQIKSVRIKIDRWETWTWHSVFRDKLTSTSNSHLKALLWIKS